MSKNPPGRVRCAIAAGFVAALASQSLLAQEQFQARKVSDRPRPLNGADVYVDDSFEGAEELVAAETLAASGRYVEAAQKAQIVIETYGRKVAATTDRGFISIARLTEETMSAWPSEALEAYRKRYDATAEALYLNAAKVGTPTALLDVADRYFLTSWGFRAADDAGSAAMEAGDFVLALQIYQDRMSHHPEGRENSAELAQRNAVCAAYLGWTNVVDRSLRELKRIRGPLELRWPGAGAIDLAEFEDRIRSIEPLGENGTGSSLPMLGGNAGRNRVSRLGDAGLARLWTSDSYKPYVHPTVESRRNGRFSPLMATEPSSPYFPVMDGQAVYFCDQYRVWRLAAGSGSLVWSYGRVPANLSDVPPQRGISRLRACSPTIDEDRLYAALGKSYRLGRFAQRIESNSALICLDKLSGRLIWRSDQSTHSDIFRSLTIDPSPLVSGESLYVVGRRDQPGGQTVSYLIKFDASTGQPIWRTQLASAGAHPFLAGGHPHSLSTLSGERVFVCTNKGVMAAVNASNGRIDWLTLYGNPDADRSKARKEFWGISESNGWATSPVVVWRQYVAAAPADSEQCILFDQGTGEIVARMESPEGESLSALLGVHKDRLFVAAGRMWVHAFELPTGRPIARSSYVELTGRGVVTDRGLILPTSTGIRRFDEGLAELGGPAMLSESSSLIGNLAATDALLIFAGDAQLTALAQKQDVYSRLKRRIASNPDDPEGYLSLAQAIFRLSPSDELSDRQEGLKYIDLAIDKSGGLVAMTPDAKRRIFQVCMSSARLLSDALPDRQELLAGVFERAGMCIPDKHGLIRYRITLARSFESRSRWESAIAQYQKLISDGGIRNMAREDEGDDAQETNVGEFAAARIAAIIGNHGRQAYEALERLAAGLLQQATSRDDRSLLERVVSAYPNSAASGQALVELAKRFMAEKDYRGAANRLQRAISNPLYRDHVDQVGLLRLLAESYSRQGLKSAAAHYLQRGELLFGDRSFDVDGRTYTFSSFRRELFPNDEELLDPKPRLGFPREDSSYTLSEGKGSSLLEPSYDFTSPKADDLFVVYSRETLMAYSTATGRKAWPKAPEWPKHPSFLLIDDKVLVFQVQYVIKAISRRNGEPLWSLSSQTGAEEEDKDPELTWTWRRFGAASGLLLATTNRRNVRRGGRIYAIDVHSGDVVWRSRLEYPVPDSVLEVGQEWLAYRSYDANNVSIVALTDIATGKRVHALQVAGDNRIVIPKFAPTGQLIVVSPEDVSCFDPFTQERLWLRKAKENSQYKLMMAIGPEAVYLVSADEHDNYAVMKRSLQTGEPLWASPHPLYIQQNDLNSLTMEIHGGLLYAATEHMIKAVDARDGRKRWDIETTGAERLRQRIIGDPHIAALDVQMRDSFDEPRRWIYQLNLYDIDREGFFASSTKLGEFESPARRISVRHSAVLLHGEGEIRGWPCPEESK